MSHRAHGGEVRGKADKIGRTVVAIEEALRDRSTAEGPLGCPKRPSNCPQQFHIKGRFADLCTGGLISRPYPHREPVLIGAPLKLPADPT
jgi:hypothetical protein